MVRNSTALGLAFVAAFVVGLAAAPAAFAQQGYFASDGAVTMQATETGAESSNRITALGMSIQCPGSTYTLHKYNSTPHGFLPNGSTTATVTPHYKETNVFGAANCTVSGIGWPVTIDMNGCDYVIHVGATAGIDTYSSTFDIVCPLGNEIVITMWTSGVGHTNPPFCSLSFTPQTGLSGVQLSGTTNGHIDLNGTLVGLFATKRGLTHHSPVLCSTGPNSTSNAKIDLDLTVSGRNEAGASTSIGLGD